MPTEYIPTQSVEYVSLGTTTANLDSPTLLLKINGIPYANGYKQNISGSRYRNFFPVYVPSTGEIRLYCQTLTYGSTTVPAETLYNIEVYIAQ